MVWVYRFWTGAFGSKKLWDERDEKQVERAQELKSPKLIIVVPCFNEEEVLPESITRLTAVIGRLTSQKLVAPSSFILFVDDGSRDATWKLIQDNSNTNHFVSGLKLARNVGHQNALLAGITTASQVADCVVSIDADLQDDLEAIPQMVKKYHEGYEIVYGVRKKRETDTFFKRFTAESFYKLMNMLGAKIVFNHADFRLLGKRALTAFTQFQEANLFIRGIIPLLGYKSTLVYYTRSQRYAGESKYPIKKMLAFAFDGITSLSVAPIRMVTIIGAVFSLLSFIAAVYAIIIKSTGNSIPGWTSIIISLWFIGGVQIMCLGMIGEYVGKIYKETKRRPKYIIETELNVIKSVTEDRKNFQI